MQTVRVALDALNNRKRIHVLIYWVKRGDYAGFSERYSSKKSKRIF